jgi:polysaccharide biosynthesis/export protein
MTKKSAFRSFHTSGFFILSMFFILSCTSKKELQEELIYFQNNQDSMKVISAKEPIIQANDLLTIQIFTKSLNQEQALPFNMPVAGGNAGGKASGSSTPAGPTPYLVETNGTIEMPIIGAVKAAGLTKSQLQAFLFEKLSSYIKDPSVIIRFSEIKVNVLGEVKVPGTYNFQRDRVTLIDAISAAGDLTDFAKRNDITVIREVNSTRKYYTADISSGDFFESPVYNLQSNDIVYIGPNNLKFKSLTSNNGQKGIQIILTLATITTTVLSIIAFTK